MASRLQDVRVVVTIVAAIGCSSACALAQPPDQPAEPPPTDAPSTSSSEPSYVPGELIVKFTPEAAQAIEQARVDETLPQVGLPSLDTLFAQYSVTAIERVFVETSEVSDLQRIYVLHVGMDAHLPQAVEAFTHDSFVEYAEPNYLATVQTSQGGLE